jgi:hypothetical protein
MSFSMPPITAAIVMSFLLMGMIGAFVLFPIACINWLWNGVIVHYWSVVPGIAIWQAFLLYIAILCVSYLSGLVQIEFKAETID